MISLTTSLFPYQQEAVDKLLPLKIGALYMEMGTGKTRTSLEIITSRIQSGKLKKVLWLCPCSVKKNLEKDLNKHCKGWEPYIKIGGIESVSASDRIFLEYMRYVDGSTMCIVDESNLVKNMFAKRTQRIFELGKICKYRMILNGTPISRNEADLYAQWYFLDHRVFGYRTFWSFAANHLEYDKWHNVRRVLDVDYLTDKIAPYSYVAKKEDVLTLPEKMEDVYTFYLDRKQVSHYNDVLDEFCSEVRDDDSTTIYRLLSALQIVTSGQRITECGKPIKSEPFYLDPRENPRIAALLDILESEDQKTIIWVKYHFESEQIAAVLEPDSFVIATGEVTVKKRAEAINTFEEDPNCKYFIATKRSGGYGLNLQFCHRAIYFSNDYDFATRAQSEDRIHRLGQEHPVHITDIVASAKIDGRILDNLIHKRVICDDVKDEIKKKKNLKAWLDTPDEEFKFRKYQKPRKNDRS